MAWRESEERFRIMANAIPQLAWIARSDGYIFWYNQRWYDCTGTTPADMEGWDWQSVHDPNVLPEVLEKWKASIATGIPFDMVFPLRGADGQFRQFLTRVMPMKDDDGRVIQWFGTNTDITERQQVAEALRQRTAELEVSNRELESFYYTVAHDLKTPVRAIEGFSRILTSEHTDKLDDEGLRLFQVITTNTKLMHHLIDDLLALARLVRQPLRKLVIDLGAMAEQVFERLKGQAPGREFQFSVKDLPSTYGDHSLFYQVMTNLLDKPIKYTESKRPRSLKWGGGLKGRKLSATSKTMASVLMSFLPIRFLALSNACTAWGNMKAPASAGPLYNASSSGMAAGSGPRARRGKGRPFILPCQKPGSESMLMALSAFWEGVAHCYSLKLITVLKSCYIHHISIFLIL